MNNCNQLVDFICQLERIDFSQEEFDELQLLKKHSDWSEISDWGMIQMLFITLENKFFYVLTINYLKYSTTTKNTSDAAASFVLSSLLEYPEKFTSFNKKDLCFFKLWIDSVYFKNTAANGAYEKWQYDENIDLLILLSDDA
jgi:hypothetical protein